MAGRIQEIEAKEAQLIAIGNGHARWAQAFIEAEDIEFPVYVDPGRVSYREFGMERGFNLRTLKHGRRARKEGFRQTEVRGDPVQNGGVVVFDESGTVVYTHIEQETGDLADLDEVVAALD